MFQQSSSLRLHPGSIDLQILKLWINVFLVPDHRSDHSFNLVRANKGWTFKINLTSLLNFWIAINLLQTTLRSIANSLGLVILDLDK